MTATNAAHEPKQHPRTPRTWKRRPPSRRSDLTPEQIAALEDEQQRQRLSKPLHVQMTPDGRELVERRAKSYGRSLSDYVRIVLLSDLKEPPPPVLDPVTGLAITEDWRKP